MMEIRFVEWGLANRFKDHIELNENLKDHPSLLNSILKHELHHTDGNDFMHDINSMEGIDMKELIKFMAFHPKTLIQILPFYIHNRKLVYDLHTLGVWGLFVGVIIITSYLTFKHF